jgi:transcriptional regulator with XRE-family HTH domain
MRGGKQDAVAIEAGISRVTLQNIESGATNFQIDKLLAVADALSVPVSWFFVDTWSTPPGSPFDDPA